MVLNLLMLHVATYEMFDLEMSDAAIVLGLVFSSLHEDFDFFPGTSFDLLGAWRRRTR